MDMNIKNAKAELAKAWENGCYRAAFGSIIRRNYDEIKHMDTAGKRQLLGNLGMPNSYE